MLDRFGEGIEAADSDTFFVIYGDNHKPRSDGIPGHGLKNRFWPKADTQASADQAWGSGVIGHLRLRV